MLDTNRFWVRNVVIVPLVIGLITAGFGYWLPKFFAESKQVSYSIEEAVPYLDKNSIGKAVIKVNDILVPEVFVVRVRVWNSGSLPLKNLGVLFEFDQVGEGFRILSTSHDTSPSKEFGVISETSQSVHSRRFEYSLLNPGDSDSVVFLTTTNGNVHVFSKSEGLLLKAVPVESRGFRWYDAALVAMLASIASTLLELLLKIFRERWSNNKSSKNSIK